MTHNKENLRWKTSTNRRILQTTKLREIREAITLKQRWRINIDRPTKRNP
jgi:hypothetical protein